MDVWGRECQSRALGREQLALPTGGCALRHEMESEVHRDSRWNCVVQGRSGVTTRRVNVPPVGKRDEEPDFIGSSPGWWDLNSTSSGTAGHHETTL